MCFDLASAMEKKTINLLVKGRQKQERKVGGAIFLWFDAELKRKAQMFLILLSDSSALQFVLITSIASDFFSAAFGFFIFFIIVLVSVG